MGDGQRHTKEAGSRNYAVVLAAGRGSRMGSAVPKQYLQLAGKPVLYHSLRQFQEFPGVHEIILVAGEEDLPYCREQIVEAYGFTKVSRIIAGGRERYDSVYRALREIRKLREEARRLCAGTGLPESLVMIHDGARPLVDAQILARSLESAAAFGSGVTGVPAKDTVKRCDGEGTILETPDRSALWIVQTPQSFSFDLIYEAYRKTLAHREEGADCLAVTDDAMMVEQTMGCPVRMSLGSYRNLKITTPEDLLIAETMLAAPC